jgi:hypothetical protein
VILANKNLAVAGCGAGRRWSPTRAGVSHACCVVRDDAHGGRLHQAASYCTSFATTGSAAMPSSPAAYAGSFGRQTGQGRVQPLVIGLGPGLKHK